MKHPDWPSCKYTPERVETICKAIEAGAPVEHAAKAAGVCQSTLSKWRRAIPEFARQCAEAEARGMVRRLEAIQAAGDKGAWQANCWLLERKYPDLFGAKVRDYEAAKREALAEAKQGFIRAREDALFSGFESLVGALRDAGQTAQEAEAVAKRWLMGELKKLEAERAVPRVVDAETVPASEDEDADPPAIVAIGE